MAVVPSMPRSNADATLSRASARPELDDPKALGVPAARCLNCDSALTGPFCAHCGQRDIPPYPSVRELAVDAFQEISGWDGRFASTARALIQRPGLLTREFLEGRRARYISPLRLYLAASLVYFVLAASAPDVRLDSGKSLFVGVRVSSTVTTPPSRPERVAGAASNALQRQQALTAAEREAALAEIAEAPPLIQPFLRRAISDPVGFKRGLLESMPRMLFALLPALAAIVAIFYRGRKYPEHLYFAIHLHAFIFFALAASALVKFTGSIPLIVLAAASVVLWIPIYATLAFRRVYGGSLLATMAKELAIGVLYGCVCLAGFVMIIYWVSIRA
jgi:hypothetical protein